MRKLLKMLEQRGIGEEEAIKYIEQSIPYKRTWKMWRFTLYLWKRVENEKKGITKNRIEVLEAVKRIFANPDFYGSTRNIMKKYYSWDRIISYNLAIYNKLLNKYYADN